MAYRRAFYFSSGTGIRLEDALGSFDFLNCSGLEVERIDAARATLVIRGATLTLLVDSSLSAQEQAEEVYAQHPDVDQIRSCDCAVLLLSDGRIGREQHETLFDIEDALSLLVCAPPYDLFAQVFI